MIWLLWYFLACIILFVLACFYMKLPNEKKHKFDNFLWLFCDPFIKMQFVLTLVVLLGLIALHKAVFNFAYIFVSWLLGIILFAIVVTTINQCYGIDISDLMDKKREEQKEKFFNY